MQQSGRLDISFRNVKASAWDAEPANIAPSKHTAAGTEGADLLPEPLEPFEPLLERLQPLLPLFELLELDFDPFRPFFSFLSFFLRLFSELPVRALDPGAGAAGVPLWRYLHLSPLLQSPCLKNLHSCLPFPFPPGLGVLEGARPPPGVRDLPLGISCL